MEEIQETKQNNNQNEDQQINDNQIFNEDEMPMKKIKDKQGNILNVNNTLNQNQENQQNENENGDNQQNNNNNQLQQQNQQQQQIIKKPTKPNSAFILFVKSYKEKFGDKINLKDAGKIWSEMPKDQKEEYYKQSEQEKNEYKQQLELYMQNQNVDDENQEKQIDDEFEIAFPISRIKGILKHDESMKGLTQDTLMYLEKATELFGSLLLEKCERNMMANKRKTLQSADIQSVVQQNPYFNFLQCLFDNPAQQNNNNNNNVIQEEDENQDLEENENDGELEIQESKQIKNKKLNNNNKINGNGSQNKGKKEKVVQPPKNNTTIDMFFKKKTN